MLGKHVDKSNLSRLNGETSDAVLLGILPPGDGEEDLVEGGIGFWRGQMEVGAQGAVDGCNVLCGINKSFWLMKRVVSK